MHLMKLAIVTTHPIQYNAPWFAILAAQPGMDVKVFYTWEQSATAAKHDKDFNRVIEWDVPLLAGYNYTFVKNISKQQGSSNYKGIDNPTLNSEIKEWGANAVLVFGWAFKSHLACMRYFKGKIPVLFRGDSTLLDETRGIKQVLRRLFLKFVYRHIDYALYVGTNNKEYFKTHGLKESQLVFVPHAIDNARFSGDSEKNLAEALSWRQHLGISKDDFVILFAGKFIAKKNPAFILKLAERIKGSNVKFLLVGNGALEDDLKRAAKDTRIIFAGFQNQSDMPKVYHACDVFILPSLGPGETWGLALNEAMACGKYIVATTRVGGAIDLVDQGKNGIVVPPNDVEAVVYFLTGIINNNNDLSIMQQTNLQKLDVYSFSRLVNKITELTNRIEA